MRFIIILKLLLLIGLSQSYANETPTQEISDKDYNEALEKIRQIYFSEDELKKWHWREGTIRINMTIEAPSLANKYKEEIKLAESYIRRFDIITRTPIEYVDMKPNVVLVFSENTTKFIEENGEAIVSKKYAPFMKSQLEDRGSLVKALSFLTTPTETFSVADEKNLKMIFHLLVINIKDSSLQEILSEYLIKLLMPLEKTEYEINGESKKFNPIDRCEDTLAYFILQHPEIESRMTYENFVARAQSIRPTISKVFWRYYDRMCSSDT